jgi:hypothetical protein
MFDLRNLLELQSNFLWRCISKFKHLDFIWYLLAPLAQWNVYPVECLPRAMLLAFHCTGAFHYSTGELEVNIPSGLNFS